MIKLEKTAQVWCICGNLGGGKTLTAVSMAVDGIRNGYYVVSNVTLSLPELCNSIPYADKLYSHIQVRNEEYDDNGNLLYREDFNPFTIPSGSPRGSGGNKRVLVILDECAEWFDQYQNARTPIFQRVTSWLRHTSKRSQDVVFIVQRREFLHKQFRSLVSRWIFVEDLATWRIPVLHVRVPFCDHLCMANVFDKVNQRVQPTTFIAKPFFGKFYNTAECLSSFGGESAEYEIPKRDIRFPFFLYLLWISSAFALFLLI